jgi:2-polyprenyl-3-methyl-5-hydroxy-6-metoxy-1,4-benzoquinol methylase
MLKNLPKSPITGNSGTKVLETFSAKDIDRLYQQQEGFSVAKYFKDDVVYLLECEETKYRFYYPFEIAGDEEFYENFLIKTQENGAGYDRDWSDDHKFAYSQIEKDETVLEIGCGTGKFLQRLSDKTKNVNGLELNSLAAEQAVKNGFEVENKLVESYAEQKPGSCDVVCTFQVLEHIVNIKSFLEASLKLLKPNGKLILSVPNNEPYFQRFSRYEVLNLPPHHIGLWNLESLTKLTDFYGINLETHHLTGRSSLKADVYLRAKLMANVQSLPRRHSFTENFKILSFAPFAFIRSGLDYLGGKVGFGHITVVFRKQ